MQIGFNNDVEADGVTYHIQTEDHGIKDGRITSQIFLAGRIVETITVSYLKAIEGLAEPDRDREIRKRMKALHALCFRNIRDGKYAEPSAKADEAPGAPPPAPPAEAMRGTPAKARRAEDERELQVTEVVEAISAEAIEAGPPPPAGHPFDEEDREPTLEMEGLTENALPEDVEDILKEDEEDLLHEGEQAFLPEGVTVAGAQEELGDDFIAAHSRGIPLEVEEIDIEELSDSSLIPLEELPEPEAPPEPSPPAKPAADQAPPADILRSPGGLAYHRGVRAFRGLDVPPDDDLPKLLTSMV